MRFLLQIYCDLLFTWVKVKKLDEYYIDLLVDRKDRNN